MTHVSIDLAKETKKEDITIVKYPPHVTDQLQPLDVTCFGPLKHKWESLLNEWVVEWGSKLTKANFVNLLSKVWHEGLKPSNVVSGFRATGIFPVDREKYKKSRLDPRLLKRYENWVRLGKPEDIMEDLATAVNTPKKVFPGTENENRNETEEQPNISFKITLLPGSSTSSPNSACQNSSIQDPSTSSTNLVQQDLNCSICNELGMKPVNVPGHKWVPVWSLQKIEEPKSNNQTNTSFAEAILNKMKGRADKPAPVKRRKVDMTTKVISDEAYLETLERYEREDEEKQKRKSILEQKRKNKKTRKELTFSESESDENMEKNDISLPVEDSTEEEVEESDDEMNESNLEEFLLNLWKSLSPPTEESDIKSKWYTFIFKQYKKKYLYVGKAIQRFLVDENGKIEYLQIDCLKRHIVSGTVLQSTPEHLPHNIYLCATHNIINGLLKMIPLRNNRWNVIDYEKVKEMFSKIVSIDRKKLYENI